MRNHHTFHDFVARLQNWMRGEYLNEDSARSSERFDQLALELFALQYENNPAYQRICRARKLNPEQVEHWKHVPFVPVVAFKELEISSIPATERTAVFHSSGTTGQQPSRHPHSAASLQVYEDSLLPWFELHFLPAGQTPENLKFLCMTPPAESVPHSSLVHMFETIRHRDVRGGFFFAGRVGEDGSWGIDDAEAIRFLERAIREHQPVAVLGTAFNFVHFLDALSNTGKRLRLPAGSRVMETGGYKGRSREMSKLELHAWICEMLGLTQFDIVCEYGMSELSSQAYDSSYGRRVPSPESQASGSQSQAVETRVFHFPPWARVQLINPETGREEAGGEMGIIRVFDLANVYSVAPLQTEDLAIRHGDGFQLIGRATEAEPRGCSLMSSGGN